MGTVQQIVPVTQLRLRHLEVFKLLDNGPVVLAQRSRPAAVLMSVEAWDERERELDRLRRIVEADRHFAEVDRGHYLTQEQLDTMLADA